MTLIKYGSVKLTNYTFITGRIVSNVLLSHNNRGRNWVKNMLVTDIQNIPVLKKQFSTGFHKNMECCSCVNYITKSQTHPIVCTAHVWSVAMLAIGGTDAVWNNRTVALPNIRPVWCWYSADDWGWRVPCLWPTYCRRLSTTMQTQSIRILRIQT